MNELVKKEEFALFTPEDVEMILLYDAIRKRYKVWEDSKRESLKAFLKEHNLESYKQDGVVIYETKPYKKKQIDTKALKEQGLYDTFAKDVWVKGSLRIQIEYEDD